MPPNNRGTLLRIRAVSRRSLGLLQPICRFIPPATHNDATRRVSESPRRCADLTTVLRAGTQYDV